MFTSTLSTPTMSWTRQVLLLLFVLSNPATADLTCLEWGLILAPIGLLCHFKPNTFNAVENATVSSAENFAEEVKDAAVFRVKHHPLVLAYDWGAEAVTHGVSAANQQLGGQIKEEVKVNVGMGKEVANTVVNIYDLTNWNDLAFCLMMSAQKAASTSGPSSLPDGAATSRVKRAQPVSAMQTRPIVDNCLSKKFHQLSHPAVFNITDPDEKVGSTLTQLASFFIPVGPEAEGAELALNGLDLAIPGSEDAGRIYQKVGEEAQHFADEADALAVKKKLDDPAWVQGNCNTCRAPVVHTAAKLVRRRSRQQHAPLSRRGASMSMCCSLPAIDPKIGADMAESSVESQDSTLSKAFQYQEDLRTYDALIPESALIQAPELSVWTGSTGSKNRILQDLARHNTAALSWSSETTQTLPSRELFPLLRRAFNPVTDADRALSRAIQVKELDGPERLTAQSLGWHSRVGALANGDLQHILTFTESAISQCKQTFRDLRGLTDVEFAKLQGSMDVYWIPASEAAVRSPDIRGVHVDPFALQFAAGDQPGLVVESQHELFRLPAPENTWHLLKGTSWGLKGSPGFTAFDATRHTVFGPQIVQNGRLSVVVNVW